MSAIEDQEIARQVVAESVNGHHDARKISASDVRLVWFSKTLGNWKAMLITLPNNGLFYEVTYNAALRKAYVDTYIKVSNEIFPIN